MSFQPGQPPQPEWFSKTHPRTGEDGLRFKCTMCGRCCTGPEGYVLVSDAEVAALSARLGITAPDFIDRFTRITAEGRSLTEKDSPQGRDCIFLDRESLPGRAICGVYEDRPAQCRTWPFWPSNVQSEHSWARAAAICPGIGSGPRYTPAQIRIQRDAFKI